MVLKRQDGTSEIMQIINHAAAKSIKPKDFFESAPCKPLNNLLNANLFCHLGMEVLAP